jgi:hypothetical protein
MLNLSHVMKSAACAAGAPEQTRQTHFGILVGLKRQGQIYPATLSYYLQYLTYLYIP